MLSSKNDLGITEIQTAIIQCPGPFLLIEFDLHIIIVVTFICDDK